MAWYPIIYPPDDFRAFVRKGSEFPVLGANFEDRGSALDALEEELDDVRAHKYPVVGFLVRIDGNGKVLETERHDP